MSCHDESSQYTNDTEELKLDNVTGIFFVLAAGLLLGFLACLVDKYTNLFTRRQKVRKYYRRHINSLYKSTYLLLKDKLGELCSV